MKRELTQKEIVDFLADELNEEEVVGFTGVVIEDEDGKQWIIKNGAGEIVCEFDDSHDRQVERVLGNNE